MGGLEWHGSQEEDCSRRNGSREGDRDLHRKEERMNRGTLKGGLWSWVGLHAEVRSEHRSGEALVSR
jgi:hypothetical protein